MTNETVTFIANHEPPLKDGQYTLTITHTLHSAETKPCSEETKLGGDKTFVKTHTFAVCGERFTLNPAEIYKVFPPANSQGDYDSILPHVVLKRRTLPWERQPQADAPPNYSWLAILVFGQDEAPKPTAGTLANLLAAPDLPDKIYSYGSPVGGAPQKFLQYGQQLKDPCTYLDVPLALFAACAPSLNDLQWNAHARQRTYTNGQPDDYAVVVANRLPPAGQTVVAHLVSLEDLGDQLPQDNGTFSLAPTWTAIRLVSLKSWSFQVGPLQESFKDVLLGLNGGFTEIPQGTGNPPINQQNQDCQLRKVAPASAASPKPFDAGYTSLQALDKQQPAWYRGPFVPSTLTLTTDDAAFQNLLPADNATALDMKVSTAYDRSYSAAWQLGRLLALADKDFAVAQVAWKRDCRLKLNAAINQANWQSADLKAAYAIYVKAKSRASYVQYAQSIIQNVSAIQEALGAALTTELSGALAIPQKLVDWLGQLALLNSVPFNYLVPEAAMLPPESIRFFNVDPRWLACLLDGAWSLGREAKANWAFDAAYQPWTQLPKPKEGVKPVKPMLQPTLPPLPPWAQLPQGTQPPACWPQSGVLLNSRLLPGYWPNIAFTTDTSAQLLREDRLGPNLLLVLFDQPFQQLTIQEPPEGLHFGFDMDDFGGLGKKLRYLTLKDTDKAAGKTPGKEIGEPKWYPAQPSGTDANDKPLTAGSELPGDPQNPQYPYPIPQRLPDTIQLAALARNMRTALNIPDPDNAGAPQFTAAEFALQLVEGVPAVTFNLP